jgi:hypothetical protein
MINRSKQNAPLHSQFCNIFQYYFFIMFNDITMNVNMKVLFQQTLKLGKKKKLIRQIEILSFTHNGGQTRYALITNVTMF